MNNDLNEFIKDENLKLYNIETGLNTLQKQKLIPKIREIRYLLNLLRNENLSKKQTKDLEKKIEKTTDKIADDTRDKQKKLVLNLAITSRIKPTTDTIDIPTREKALMVKASSNYETQPDKTLNDSFLEDNNINYNIDPELSTAESIVLVNNNNPQDIKVAYRGSKMNNLGDWISNGRILAGKEKNNLTPFEDDRFGMASQQINNVKTKYGVLPKELLGTSRGGTLSIAMGDKFSIDTTTFNPFLGKNLLKSTESSANHTVWRTTEDIPSLALGFKTDLDNYDINVIRPLKDSIDVREAHYLKNFIERTPRADSNDPNLMENKLTKLTELAKKHGESQSLADAASVLEGSDFIPVSKDIYNTRKKIANNNPDDPLLGHEIQDEFYEVGQQTTNPMENKVDKMLRDENRFKSEVDDFKRQLGLFDEDDDFGIRVEPEPIKVKKNILKQLQAPSEIDDDFEIKPASKPSPLQKVKDRAIEMKNKLNILQDNINNKPFNNDSENVTFNEAELQAREERIATKKALRLSRQDELELRTEAPRLDADRPNITSGKVSNKTQKTLTDFIESISPADVIKNPDGSKSLSSRINEKSGFVNLWDDISNGSYTQSEANHLDSIDTSDMESHKFSLSQDERNSIYKATPEERHRIVKGYEQDAHDFTKEFDTNLSVGEANPEVAPRTITGDIASGLNPINLGIGLGISIGVNKLLDKIDPNMSEIPKSLISGSLSGGLAEASILGLSGAGSTIGAITLAPAIIGGAAGGFTGLETYKGLKSVGASDLESSAGSGAAAGFVAAPVALGVAAGTGALLGAEAGIPLDTVTLGGASVVGAGLGTIMGLAGYGLGKLGII